MRPVSSCRSEKFLACASVFPAATFSTVYRSSFSRSEKRLGSTIDRAESISPATARNVEAGFRVSNEVADRLDPGGESGEPGALSDLQHVVLAFHRRTMLRLDGLQDVRRGQRPVATPPLLALSRQREFSLEAG